jgi:anti-sigma factor RsiW
MSTEMVQTPGEGPPSPCEQLLDYAYGELEGEAHAAFERHLAGCARCQAELASIERVRGAVRAVMPMVEPPQATMEMGALHAQLLHAAAQRKPAGGGRRGKVLELKRPWKRVQRAVLHPAFAAAAVFVVVGGVVGLQWKRSVEPAPMVAAERTAAPATPAVAAPAPMPAAGPGAAAEPAADSPMVVDKPVAAKSEGTKDSFYLGSETGESYRVRGESPATGKKAAAKEAVASRKADRDTTPLLRATGGDGFVDGRVAKAEAKPTAPAKPAPLAQPKGSTVGGAVGGATSADDLASLARRDSAAGPGAPAGTWNAQTRNWASPSSSASPASPPPPPTTMPVVSAYESEKGRSLGKSGRAGASTATSFSTPPAGGAFGSAPSQALAPQVPSPSPSPMPGAGGVAQQAQVRGPNDGALAKNASEMRKKADELARTGRCDEANTIYQQLEKSVTNFKLTMTERANLSHCRGQQGRTRATQDELDSLKAAEPVPLEERQQQRAPAREKKQRMPQQSFEDAEASPSTTAARPAPAEAPAAPMPAPATTSSPAPSRKAKKAADSAAY